MGLTLRQAADMCGRSRSTIHRALKSGKLSGVRSDDGAWSIDPSELARVFPWDVTGHAQRDTTEQSVGQPVEQGGEEAAVLRTKVEMLEQQLERERDTVDDLRRRLDKAEERVYLLSAPKEPQQQLQPTQLPTQEASESLWRRLKYVLAGGKGE